MKKILLVVDMQNDFISGALGSNEAKAIVENATERVKDFDGEVIFTRDTHFENYEQTQEGRKLPVRHCIKDTYGWEVCDELKTLPVYEKSRKIDKLTFGSDELAVFVKEEKPDEVYLLGLCTDICVISNAMLVKAFSPETEVFSVFSPVFPSPYLLVRAVGAFPTLSASVFAHAHSCGNLYSLRCPAALSQTKTIWQICMRQ